MSGYAEHARPGARDAGADAERARQAEPDALLQKPFTNAELLAAVRRAVEG